ncbi:MAG: HEAT repeat domain-containing protein [Planctomycetota bacterium]
MATGGIPLARVIVLLALVAMPATSIMIDSTAAAQDAGDLLKTGLEQVRAGKYKEGIATLRQALAADPSSEEVMQALGRAEYEALLAVMASGQEGRLVVMAILNRAMPTVPAEAFNAERLAELVKLAVEGDEEQRFDAASELSRVYGEFAVPGLLAYLKSSNTDHRINAHITLQNRIGRDAVLPLNEAMQSSDAGVRRLVAIELGNIGDMRSLAALTEAATKDSDEGVRTKAAEALEKIVARNSWAQGMNASQLYLRLAKLYYDGNYRVLSRSDRPIVVWRWDGGLKRMAVPRFLYVLKLAEEAAYDAMAADETNTDAAATLARILASQRIAAAAALALAEEDETLMAAAKGLANVTGLLAGLGWTTLNQALAESLAQEDNATAASLLSMMHHTYSGDEFGEGSPVVAATGSSSALVRYAAAEAVLRFNGLKRIASWPNPDAFMGLVAQGIGESVPRSILVIDANDNRRNKMITELNKAKMNVYPARSGADGFVRATRLAGVDLVVMSSDLADMEALELLAKMKDNDLTKNVPVVIVGGADQVSNDQWRNLYKERVGGIAPIPEGPGLPTAEFLKVVKGTFGEEGPGAKARYMASSQILDALAGTDAGNGLFNWESLTETLAAMLGAELPDDIPVRIGAIRSLGNIRSPGSLQQLANYFANESDPVHKAAAGLAIANVNRAHGITMTEDVFNKVLAGTGSSDAAVRLAAFAALGSSQLTPAQMREVAMRNRPTLASMGGDEDE